MPSLTILIKNLRPLVTKDDIKTFFDNRIPRKDKHGISMVSAVGRIYSPAADHSKRRAIVSFTSANKARQALNIKDRCITATNGGNNNDGKSTMEFDRNVSDLQPSS
jgi:hypothetical protein